jgi:hypothetical protein
MFDTTRLREIEHACRLRSPRIFRAAIAELSDLVDEPEFQAAFPDARLIATLPEVFAAHREGVPDWLVPLMVVGRHPEIEWYVYHPDGCFLRWWRVGHDVTCFRHRDEVAGWRGLTSFLGWCREYCASVGRRKPSRCPRSRRPQPPAKLARRSRKLQREPHPRATP